MLRAVFHLGGAFRLLVTGVLLIVLAVLAGMKPNDNRPNADAE
jgi:hypothetical protein